MKARQIVCIGALLFLLVGCGPSAEQVATMTAAAWTPTPLPTPTATPVPYALKMEVVDEAGAPIEGARIVLHQSGSDQPVEADAAGQYIWPDLPGLDAAASLSAPGYFSAEESLTLERGLTEKTVSLQRDPLGLLAADACAPDEKLLYIEDYQDGKAQGWRSMTAGAEYNAQNGWSIAAMEDSDQVAVFTGGHEDLDDMEALTFDNLVWRLRVMTQGADGFSFLNLRHAPKQGGETRYTIQWGANPLLALARLDFPDIGHFDVARSQFRARQGQWYYVEVSYFQGQIQIWVDGKKQIEWQDPQPLPAGMISLEAHAPKDPNTFYYFDDLSVCELDAPFTTSLYKAPAQ